MQPQKLQGNQYRLDAKEFAKILCSIFLIMVIYRQILLFINNTIYDHNRGRFFRACILYIRSSTLVEVENRRCRQPTNTTLQKAIEIDDVLTWYVLQRD